MGSYAKTLKCADEGQTYFYKLLEGENRRRFEARMDIHSELASMTGFENFLDGFRLGADFLLEALMVEPERSFHEL